MAAALRLDDDALEIRAGGFKAGKELRTVAPVEFRPYFLSVGEEPPTDFFSFTVSGRGLFEKAELPELTHPYPELVFPATTVPVMDLTEQLAEKICGWCIHGLLKHYIDVAWAFDTIPTEIRNARLGPLTEKKLEVGRKLFPDAYKAFPNLRPVLKALRDPDEHVPPLGDERDKREALRFSGPAINYQRAIAIVRAKALPALLTATAQKSRAR